MHQIRVRRFQRNQSTDIGIYDRFADSERNALDIGANHGTVTRLLGQRFKRVHAFEPDPVNLTQLRAHAPENVSIHAVALAAMHGSAEMRTPIWGGAPSRGHGSLSKTFDGHQTTATTVSTLPLDALNLSNIGFVKIDVEGFELAVLQGARQTLKRERPPIWIEVEAIHGGSQHIGAVFEELHGLGYGGTFHWNREWKDIGEFRVETHQPKDGATRLPGEFVTDFLFTATTH